VYNTLLYSVAQRGGQFYIRYWRSLSGGEKFELYSESGDGNFKVYQTLTLKTPGFNRTDQPRTLSECRWQQSDGCSVTVLSPRMLSLINHSDSRAHPSEGFFLRVHLKYILSTIVLTPRPFTTSLLLVL